MGYLGIIKLGANLTFYANTHTPSTGAAVDADAVPGYRVYEDETATPLLTGSMALLDDANTTGFYSEQIAVTAGNGFEAGKSYCVRITGVVGGVTGVEVHQFDVDTKRVSDLNDAAAAPAMITSQAVRDAMKLAPSAGAPAAGSIDTLATAANNGTPPTADAISDAVHDEAIGAHSGYLATRLDATVSSRSTYAGGAVASVTAPVTVGTNSDKTGYALTADYNPAKTAAQAGDAMALTSGERDNVAAALLDLANGVETSHTVRQVFRLMAAVLLGKSSNSGNTFRDLNDTKNRVLGTVDVNNNRTAVTRDAT